MVTVHTVAPAVLLNRHQVTSQFHNAVIFCHYKNLHNFYFSTATVLKIFRNHCSTTASRVNFLEKEFQQLFHNLTDKSRLSSARNRADKCLGFLLYHQKYKFICWCSIAAMQPVSSNFACAVTSPDYGKTSVVCDTRTKIFLNVCPVRFLDTAPVYSNVRF